MHCENPNCYCQSEVGLIANGRQFCSERCLTDGTQLAATARPDDACRCGHAGCSTADELEKAEPESARV